MSDVVAVREPCGPLLKVPAAGIGLNVNAKDLLQSEKSARWTWLSHQESIL